MADHCYVSGCPNISNGDCASCGRPVCRRHSKEVSSHVLCHQCIDKAR